MAIWRLARIQGRACWDGSLTRYTNMKTGRCENARACNCGRRSLPRCGATIVCTLSGRDQSGGARDQHGRRVAVVIPFLCRDFGLIVFLLFFTVLLNDCCPTRDATADWIPTVVCKLPEIPPTFRFNIKKI